MDRVNDANATLIRRLERAVKGGKVKDSRVIIVNDKVYVDGEPLHDKSLYQLNVLVRQWKV